MSFFSDLEEHLRRHVRACPTSEISEINDLIKRARVLEARIASASEMGRLYPATGGMRFYGGRLPQPEMWFALPANRWEGIVEFATDVVPEDAVA